MYTIISPCVLVFVRRCILTELAIKRTFSKSKQNVEMELLRVFVTVCIYVIKEGQHERDAYRFNNLNIFKK